MNTIELSLPAEMSAGARAAEITTILAAAIVRSQLEQTAKQRNIGLGLLPSQSVHITPSQQKRLS